MNKLRKIIKYETTPTGILDNLISLIMIGTLWSAGIWVLDWQFWAIVVCEGLRLGIKQYRTRTGDLPPWP